MLRLVTLALLAAPLASCATLFTGFRQEVALTSTPSGATVAIVSGPGAEMVLKAKKVSDLKDQVVNRLLGDALSPDARQVLLSLSTDELFTQLVLWVGAQRLPPEVRAATSPVQQLLQGVPLPLREAVAAYLGLAAVRQTPGTVALRKGREYLVLAWHPGHRARLLEVETRFNWVVLLNVFTLGLGVVVDALTGAWLNLAPSEVSFALEPLPPEAHSVLPDLPLPPPPAR